MCLGSQARNHVKCLQAIPIKVSLVLGGWLDNLHHLVVIQLHAVQVARGSDWILRMTSSALQTVTRCCGCCHCVFAFHFFPSFTTSCRFESLQLLQCEEVVNFILPSPSRSSHWPACLVSDAEAGVPFCSLLCPSFIWWRCNPRCQ